MAIASAVPTNTSRTADDLPRNLNLALAVIAVAQLMVILDATIVNIALPSIQRALHFSPTGLEWVINAYSLTFGGLLLLGGRAGDLFGRRRMFTAGIVLFTLGSLAGGFANSDVWLIAARAAQGVGAAIVAPTALSLIADTFSRVRRATVRWVSMPRWPVLEAPWGSFWEGFSPTLPRGAGFSL